MRYGLFASAFSPFPHPGHVDVMHQAVSSGACDSVIALLHKDPSIERPFKRTPPLTVFERTVMLDAIRFVCKVIPYETESDLERFYKLAKQFIDCVVIVGKEYQDAQFTGRISTVPVFWSDRYYNWSGTEFSHRICWNHIAFEQRNENAGIC
jgi:glycerol-3-phosphate cytidylyltransferase-like family protein